MSGGQLKNRHDRSTEDPLSKKWVDDKGGFSATYETNPPKPVEAVTDSVICGDDSAIPANLFPAEHVANTGNLKILRAGVLCPNCESDVFLHPDSVIPCNTVQCAHCHWCSLNHIWWADPTIDSFQTNPQKS